jgi:hypothetical protein
MPRLVAHVHHDLALGLEGVHGLFQLSELGIGEVERDAQHRLLVGTPPFVGEITDRSKLLEAALFELLVKLAHIPFDG